MSDLECKTCDTNTAEPAAPKVIVVTEAPVGERAPLERRYLADAEEGADYGYLHLVRDGRQIARYQPMAWLSVRDDGALVPDVTLRKLGLAMQALREIGATVLEADDKRRVPVRIARDAQIADVDL
jgi:hypothetical protein